MQLSNLYTEETTRKVLKLLVPDTEYHTEGRKRNKYKCVMTEPEVLPDKLLANWLAFNYIWTVGFKADGTLIMGEVGGIIPTHPKKGKQILATAEASIYKILLGINAIKEAEKTGDKQSEKQLLSQLEEEIETSLEQRGKVTVVNGNRNFAHYDFTTSVAREDPLDIIKYNPFMDLSAHGATVLSYICLKDEQYIFNVPVNTDIFRELAFINTENTDNDAKIELMRAKRSMLIPDQFVAGFHIKYKASQKAQETTITITPVIAERDAGEWIKELGLKAKDSPISYLGNSGPQGEFAVMTKVILD